MSHEGKMHRGKKWLEVIRLDTSGKAEEAIKADPEKQCDVDYYLEHKENKPEPIPKLKKGVK